MRHWKSPRTLLITALLASAPALLPGPAAAAPAAMIVLASATYDNAALSDKANAITTDPEGNVYVTGVSGNDYLSIEYSKTLVPGIPISYSNGRPSNIARAIAVDGLGNIIVAGEELNAAARQAYLVLKYSPGFGAQLSSAVYDGGDISNAVGVKTDSQNNVYVTGYTKSLTENFYTIKYNSALTRVSTAAFESGDDDQAAGITLSGDNVIVAGMTRAGGTNDNFRIVRYDSNLKYLNDISYDSGGNEKITGVVSDSAGNIIVTGRQNNANTDFLTMKYDGILNFVSSAVYNSGAADIPTGIAVDSNDNIIITGHINNNNYLTIKYDQNLNLISSAAYDSGSTEQANAVTVDADDNVIITGQVTHPDTSENYFTIKYNASPKITEVSPLYIGETAAVVLKGYGFVAGSSVAFTDAGISTGTIAFASGQLTVQTTLASSVKLGVTTVTVSNINGEAASNFTLASARLRKTITAGSSGVLAAVTTAGPVTVTIPAGTFPQQELVTLYTVAPAAGDVRQVGQAVFLAVSPADTPLQNITVKLPYRVADLAGYQEAGLGLAYYNTLTGWVNLPASVNATDKTVTAVTKTINAKFAVVKAGEGVGIPTPGGLGGGKVYPSPYRPGSGGNFDQSALGEGIVFAELGANAAFTLTIVDVAGQLVYAKSGTANADGKYLWDVKTVSGGKAASGVYLYLIKGSGDPKKGKFSIIR